MGDTPTKPINFTYFGSMCNPIKSGKPPASNIATSTSPLPATGATSSSIFGVTPLLATFISGSNTMEKLPNDLLSKIFIRLLAKQLAQMRSVSKSWNSLLSQSSFIKSHLHRSLQNNDEVLLFFHQPVDIFCEPFSAHPTRSPDLKLTNFIKPPFNSQWVDASVIGSVDGLICFSYFSSYYECVLQIWNPSLSAVLTLPPHSVPPPDFPNLISFNFRFGFDPNEDDYKVVNIVSLRGQPSFKAPTSVSLLDTNCFMVKEWLHIEVYSMRKGCWKPITQTPPSHITGISRRHEVCVDGHDGLLHWVGSIGEEKKEQTIVALDLHVETFHEVRLPDSIIEHNRGNRSINLGVLGGKLCVMSWYEKDAFEVWVMDEYGVVESWVKRHTFSQFGNKVPFGFTLRNQLLYEIHKIDGIDDEIFDDHWFGLYDPVAAKTKFFRLCEPITKIVGYLDSLVWVAPDEREIRGSDLHHDLFLN